MNPPAFHTLSANPQPSYMTNDEVRGHQSAMNNSRLLGAGFALGTFGMLSLVQHSADTRKQSTARVAVTNLVVGAISGGLAMMLFKERYRREQSRRRIVRTFSHHVGNSLQVIRFAAEQASQPALSHALSQAVSRIQWALHEAAQGEIRALQQPRRSPVLPRQQVRTILRRVPTFPSVVAYNE